MSLWCKVFGHKWTWYLCSGDDGEPSEDRCHHCKVTRVYIGTCRCLGPKCLCLEGFLKEIREGKPYRKPPLLEGRYDRMEPPLTLFEVEAALRGANPKIDEDFAPVVIEKPKGYN